MVGGAIGGVISIIKANIKGKWIKPITKIDFDTGYAKNGKTN
jgi:hypothetical protein